MFFRLLLAALFVSLLHAQAPPSSASVSGTEPQQPPKPASLSGRIASASGQPLKKTNLSLRPMGPYSGGGSPPSPYTATADAEGKFVFEAVDPGRYMLSADRPGYQRINYGARKPGAPGTVLTLTAGQVMGALNIVMSPQIVISGKVLDADGDPAGRAQVRAWRTGFMNGKRQLMPYGFAATDENGEYKLQNLVPGKYFLSASAGNQYFGQESRSAAAPPTSGEQAKQEEAVVQTFYPSVTDRSAAQQIEVSSQDRPGVDITLRKVPVVRVRGKVTGLAAAEGPEARVMLMPKGAAYFDNMGASSSLTGKEGVFEIRNVPPGSYNAVFTRLSGMLKLLGMTPVEVGNRSIDDLIISSEPPFELQGQITTEKADKPESDPAKPAETTVTTSVYLTPQDGPMMNQVNGKVPGDGPFTLAGVTPGRYHIFVAPLPEGSYLKAVRFGDQDGLAGFNVPPGSGATRIEITLALKAGKMEGTVQDAEGKPATSASVTLIPDPFSADRTDLFKQTNTDQTGKFSLKNLAPGKYRIYAWDDLEQGAQYDLDFMKNFETKAVKLDLQPSGSEQVSLTVIKQ